MIPNTTINVIAQSSGFPARELKEDVLNYLAQDVEFRLRQVIQAGKKFMKHSKRKKLTTDDISQALLLKNIEPLYGYKSGQKEDSNQFRFARVPGNDLYFIPDETINVMDQLSTPLQKFPTGPKVKSHWLAINGVQPRIPENPIPETIVRKKFERKGGLPEEERTFVVDQPIESKRKTVKHVLSDQLIKYYEKVTEIIVPSSSEREDNNESNAPQLPLHRKRIVVMDNLKNNPSLHQLVPYLILFIHEQAREQLHNTENLHWIAMMVHALLQNPYIHLELYITQLIPPLISLCIGDIPERTINPQNTNNSSSQSTQDPFSVPRTQVSVLRDFCGRLLSVICHRYRSSYPYLLPKLQKTLLQTLLDPDQSLGSHFGAIRCITMLGYEVTYYMLLQPMNGLTNLELYCKWLKRTYLRHDSQISSGLKVSKKTSDLHKKKKRRRGKRKRRGEIMEDEDEDEDEEEEEEEDNQEEEGKESTTQDKEKIQREALLCWHAMSTAAGMFFHRLGKYFQAELGGIGSSSIHSSKKIAKRMEDEDEEEDDDDIIMKKKKKKSQPRRKRKKKREKRMIDEDEDEDEEEEDEEEEEEVVRRRSEDPNEEVMVMVSGRKRRRSEIITNPYLIPQRSIEDLEKSLQRRGNITDEDEPAMDGYEDSTHIFTEDEIRIHINKELKERRIMMEIPEDIHSQYKKMWSLFGESVLPYIDFDVVKKEEESDILPLQNAFL